eukprot:ctg_3461.g631
MARTHPLPAVLPRHWRCFWIVWSGGVLWRRRRGTSRLPGRASGTAARAPGRMEVVPPRSGDTVLSVGKTSSELSEATARERGPSPSTSSLRRADGSGQFAARRWREALRHVPEAPGVYWFRDAAGQWLYVGKSKCLRARVATYFHRSGAVRERGLHFEALAQRVDTIDYLVTRSEVEALALEANLIREQQPPYNALLKDDKRYPYVCVTWSEAYPRILVTRRRRREVGGPLGRDRLYGPFVDSKRLQVVLSAVKRAFPLRQRPVPVHTDRPCLNYDIGLCPGVCQRLITPEAYRQVVQRAEWVFQGRYGELAQHLEEQMVQAALHEEFERAARLRDAHRVLCAPADAPTAAAALPPSRSHLEAHASQCVVLEDSRVSCDAVAAALSADGALASVHLLQVRSGLIVN